MWGTTDQLLIVFSNINNYGKSHEYQQKKFQNKQQEAALHITNSRSAELRTEDCHGWKNCLYVFTRRLDKH